MNSCNSLQEPTVLAQSGPSCLRIVVGIVETSMLILGTLGTECHALGGLGGLRQGWPPGWPPPAPPRRRDSLAKVLSTTMLVFIIPRVVREMNGPLCINTLGSLSCQPQVPPSVCTFCYLYIYIYMYIYTYMYDSGCRPDGPSGLESGRIRALGFFCNVAWPFRE